MDHSEGQIRIFEFFISHQVQFGWNIYVTGSSKTLGEWNVEKAKRLRYIPEHNWVTRVYISPEDSLLIEYKYFIQNETTKEVIWENTPNRTLVLKRIVNP
jgi:hypothetical protein